MAIAGLRSTADFSQYRERPENWRHGILLLDPNGSAPLYALTSMMKSEATSDPTFHWFEEELPNFRVAVNEDVDNSEPAITVESGATYLKEGDILYAEHTGELMVVTANPVIDTEIQVQRGFAGTTPAAITMATQNPNLLLVGSSYEEGSDAPQGRTYSPVERDNHCQIFRDTFEVTNTAVETEYRTGDTVKEDKRRCLTKHSIGIERAWFLGRKSLTMKNGKPRRTTDGVIAQIPIDRQFSPAANQKMTMDEFEDWMRQVFLFGSNEKVAYGGNRFLLGLQQVVRKNSHFNITSGIKEYGMNVTRFTTPFGELVVKNHPLFNQVTSGRVGGSNPFYAMDTWGVILDMAFVKYRYLKNRDTKYEPKLQQDGVDGLQSGYITEAGLQLSNTKTHAVIRGVIGGAKDA